VTRSPSGGLLLAIGYGAGLATGLSHFPAPAFVALVLVCVAAVLRREAWWPTLLAAAAGVCAGAATRHASHDLCATQLPAGPVSLMVRTVDPGVGTGRVAVIDQACSGTVTARWPTHARLLVAGAVVHVAGQWRPTPRAFGRPDGVLAIDSVHVLRVAPSAVERWHTRIVANAHAEFGDLAPVAIAMLTGARGELRPDLRDAFAGAGMMHLLTVSGLQIAWLGGWLLLLLRVCGVPRHPAETGAALAGLAVAGALGWPAAATRAAMLLLLVACCRWRQRHIRVDALLAASALLTLAIDPWALAGVGFWLSITGVTGVVVATRWTDRTVGRAWWMRGISASAGAVVATAPIAAVVFNIVAPISIVTGMLALPVMTLLFPALVAATALHSAWPALAAGFASWSTVLLHSVVWLAQRSADVPRPDIAGTTWRIAIPWVVLAGALAWVIHGRATMTEAVRRTAWVAATCLAVTVFAPPQRADVHAGDLTFFFADVGQGDGALIRTPRGHWIEIDAGPDEVGQDAGRRVMLPLLRRNGGRRIDLFVLSHAHRDHVGGATEVVDEVPVDLSLEPGELFADSAYQRWLGALAMHHDRWRSVREGSQWTIDSVSFLVLHPPVVWPREGEDLNEDSIVLLVTYRGFRALLMGDAGMLAESAMAGELVPVNLLKVGHHGSRTASGAEFLASVRPQAAIVSVGRHNRYGHPSPETLARLAAAGAQLWRTDVDGTVTVMTDGTVFSVKGARGTATFGTIH
jgi:competence protein ComEC